MDNFHDEVERLCREGGMEFERMGFTLGPRGHHCEPVEIAHEILQAYNEHLRQTQRPMEEQLREALLDAHITLAKILRLAYVDTRKFAGKMTSEQLRLLKMNDLADWAVLSTGNFLSRDETKEARRKAQEELDEWKDRMEQLL